MCNRGSRFGNSVDPSISVKNETLSLRKFLEPSRKPKVIHTISRRPTTVITAKGEVQTHEKVTVYVRELDVLLTVRILEDTPTVLWLGKLCEDHGYSYAWANGQKPCLIKNGVRIQCNTENYVTIVVLGLSTTSSTSILSGLTPPTSLPQESTGSTPFPASFECESADEQTRGNPSFNSAKNPHPNTDGRLWASMERSIIFRNTQKSARIQGSSEGVLDSRDSHASSLHEPCLELLRQVVSGKKKVFIFTSRKTEIARSVRWPKFHEVLEGNAQVKPYLVQKIFVTW